MKTSAPASGKTPAYDLTFLRDFTDGDAAQMEYFIQTFLERYPLEIQRLDTALQAGDRNALYQAAHSFRPQLAFLGLKQAQEWVSTLEKGAAEQVPFDALANLLSQTQAALADLPPAPEWLAG